MAGVANLWFASGRETFKPMRRSQGWHRSKIGRRENMKHLDRPPTDNPVPAKNAGLKDNLNGKCIFEIFVQNQGKTLASL